MNQPLRDATELPELQQATLDEEMVRRVFADIQACAQVVEVLAKHGPQTEVREEALRLDQSRDLLLEGQARGVQVRYLYDGALWWDVFLKAPGGFRLTRIRHEAAGPA